MLRLALVSRLAGLRRRASRWLDGGPPSLDGIEEVPTVSDHVDTAELTQWLPAQWRAAVELVQFQGEPLAEVVRLTNQHDGTRITVKPVELEAPTESVDVYIRRSPRAARRHRETVDSLAAGLTEATRLAVDHRQRGLRARSSSHRSPPAARQPAEF